MLVEERPWFPVRDSFVCRAIVSTFTYQINILAEGVLHSARYISEVTQRKEELVQFYLGWSGKILVRVRR